MNKIIVSGKLAKDVVIGDTKNGIRRALFTVASKSKTKDSDGTLHTDFFKCIAWRQNAEIIAKYLKKGDNIVCYGYIQQKAIMKPDGTTQYYTEVNVDDFEFNGITYDKNDKNDKNDKEYEDDWFVEEETSNNKDIPF